MVSWFSVASGDCARRGVNTQHLLPSLSSPASPNQINYPATVGVCVWVTPSSRFSPHWHLTHVETIIVSFFFPYSLCVTATPPPPPTPTPAPGPLSPLDFSLSFVCLSFRRQTRGISFKRSFRFVVIVVFLHCFVRLN